MKVKMIHCVEWGPHKEHSVKALTLMDNIKPEFQAMW